MRTLVRALPVLALALLATVVGGAKADANHFHQANHAVQANLWGYEGNTQYNPYIANEILTRVDQRNPTPLAFSFNEVCLQQYNDITFGLYYRNLSYSSFQTWTRGQSGTTPVNSTNCSQWGNAAMWLGGNANSFYLSYYSNNTAGQEQRNWACGHAVYPDYWICTTHLRANDATAATTQAGEYYNAVQSLVNQGKVVLAAGDFNLDARYGQVPYYFWASFHEADNLTNSAVTSRPTTDGGSKFDYIFRANPATTADGAYIEDLPTSDHKWYQMFL